MQYKDTLDEIEHLSFDQRKQADQGSGIIRTIHIMLKLWDVATREGWKDLYWTLPTHTAEELVRHQAETPIEFLSMRFTARTGSAPELDIAGMHVETQATPEGTMTMYDLHGSKGLVGNTCLARHYDNYSYRTYRSTPAIEVYKLKTFEGEVLQGVIPPVSRARRGRVLT